MTNAFHKGYANKRALPTSVRRNPTFTKAAVWKKSLFFSFLLKVQWRGQIISRTLNRVMFSTVAWTQLKWPTWTNEVHADINHTVPCLVAKTKQVWSWVLNPPQLSGYSVAKQLQSSPKVSESIRHKLQRFGVQSLSIIDFKTTRVYSASEEGHCRDNEEEVVATLAFLGWLWDMKEIWSRVFDKSMSLSL